MKPIVVAVQQGEQIASTVEIHGKIQMCRVLQGAIVKTSQVDLQEPHLERIIQLGVPRTSCPGHDVPFLAIEGRNILANLLHHLQRIHLPIFKA